MKIKLYSDKDIREEGAIQVTSSNYFKNNIPDPDGLFSPLIFGVTPEEKLKKIGKINLGRKLLHPLIHIRVYERSFRKIDSMIRGDEKFSVVGGKLVSDPENGKTGLDYFISIMDQLNLTNGVANEEDSLISAKLKESMKNLNKEDVLISSWVVTPLAYRDVSTLDVDLSAIDESNNLYRDLIRLVDYYENAKTQPLVNMNMIIYRMQMKINAIFNYFEGLTFKKFGIQNKLVLARNIDYSSRLIISAIDFNADNYNTHWSKWDTAGVPLSAVATNGMLFALHHSERVIEDLYNSGGFEHAGKSIPLESLKRDYFNKEVIAEMIDHYYSSWGERLEYVKIPGTETPVTFKYKENGSEKEKPLTLLEFIYMLVYVPIELGQRCVMCRRYPIQGAFSIISLKTHVSTINKVKAIEFMGQEFPYFPDSDSAEQELHASKNKSLTVKERAFKAGHITTIYLETLLLSNILQEGYNMDFDGDKLAVSILITDEANNEALKFLEDPQSMFTLGGYNYRKVLNKESISGLYGLTVEDIKAKPIPDELAKELVESKDFNRIAAVVLDTYKDGKVSPSKYKIESPCNFVYKNKTYKTTLGRAFFNSELMSIVDHDYVNDVLTKKVQEKILEDIDNMCLTALSKENLTYFTNTFIPFLNNWERFVFVAADLFSPSIDMDVYATSKEYDKYREKLLAENKEAIDRGDLEVYDMIEKSLTAKFKETNKADTAIFDSGSNLAITKDLRMGVIGVGPMPIGVGAGKYAISTSTLVEGTKKDERATYAQSNTISGYFRAMGPAVGGEQAKEILAASHDIKLDAKGTDCGRKEGQWYTINDYFVNELDMRYMIKPNGGIEMLTREDLKNKYFGKRIQVRSVHFCKNPKFCNICSGEKPYIIARGDTINIGAQTSIAGDEITQASLGKFHQNKTQFIPVDFNDFITPADFRFTEAVDLSDNLMETFRNLNEFNHVLITEENESLAEELADDIEDIMDEIIINNPDTFDDVMDDSIRMDVHKLSAPMSAIEAMFKDFGKHAGSIIKLYMVTFEDTPNLNLPNYMNVLNTLEMITTYDTATILTIAAGNDWSSDRPYLSRINDKEDEYAYYRLYMNMINIPFEKAITSGVHPQEISDKLERLTSSLNEIWNVGVDIDEPKWIFTKSEDEEGYYIFLEPNIFILDIMVDENIARTAAATEEGNGNLAEAVVLSTAEKSKMDKKIKNSKESIRRRFESAISTAMKNAGRQKVKAKASIGETINHRAAQLEVDMRNSKNEYKKHLAELLNQFELDFIKKNKFKLFKLRNKLNFIYSKKSSSIETAMLEGIKALKKKMYSKQKESEEKIKTKFGQ